ncbi:MAG: DUF1080 domain-containing protein [Planctomycetaceae bacterium]|nr:DUF1080 domain-containing protein [Planctomycetaceae bacterium]
MKTTRYLILSALFFGALSVSPARAWLFKEWKSGIEWREPEVIDPGSATQAPSDAIVLFDGTDLSAWEGGEKWTIENGYAIDGGNIDSKQHFGDCQLHLEFATPEKIEGNGQGRGNSGVYFMGKYELQILDSYENETYFDGQCGAIYKQSPPLVNACRKPGEWQTYDIIFTAPKFHDDGTLKSPAAITALHNGVLIQNHFELLGGTFWDEPPHYETHGDKGPIHIQFHGNPVKFRNIWIRDLSKQQHATENPAAEASKTPSESDR